MLIQQSLDFGLEIKPTYPSSSKKHIDWSKLEKSIEADAKDDEGDVNSLFSKIYNSGDENTKRAMMKSMVIHDFQQKLSITNSTTHLDLKCWI